MVRCLKCGASIDGFAQLCDNCAAEKRAADEAARVAVSTSVMPCPWCHASMPRAAIRCPSCFREWADYRRPATGMGGVQRGDFWIRLVAVIIDTVILIIPSLIIALIVPPPVGSLFGALLSIAYNVGFWTKTGATPGKMAMGLREVDSNGELLTFWHAVGRHFSYILGGLTLGIDYLMVFGEQHLALHDRVSSSQVVFANTLPVRQLTTSETQPAV
jgi:uncharacterized RDD family membrane protein YckC